MKNKFKLGQELWTLGLTIRNSGTQHPNAYYLPIKCRIWEIHLQLLWNNDWTRKDKVNILYRVTKVNKQNKSLKEQQITKTVWDGGAENMCEQKYLSVNKNDLLKIAREWNRHE